MRDLSMCASLARARGRRGYCRPDPAPGLIDLTPHARILSTTQDRPPNPRVVPTVHSGLPHIRQHGVRGTLRISRLDYLSLLI
jgi:hypothetical protein